MAEYDINNPRARAQRVAEAGGIQGSTPESQQLADLENIIRRRLGLPLIPILGLDQGKFRPDGTPADPPAGGQTLPMHTADP